jgi:plasminogen activator inhibitor 1 RNA-binding protein
VIEIIDSRPETIGLTRRVAYRDRNAGRTNNREKPTDEAAAPARRGPRNARGDRQSRTGQT